MSVSLSATSPVRLLAAWSRRRAIAQLTRHLQSRTDRLLADVGLTRGDIDGAVLRAYPAPSTDARAAAASAHGWTLQPG